MKSSILFICIGNSCRSQMAEGFMRSFHGESFDAASAGIRSSSLNPYAVTVMKEIGIDISSHTSKTLEDVLENRKESTLFDYAVTVCKDGEERCPYLETKKGILHRAFDDPPHLTADWPVETEKEQEKLLAVYRRVRDEIKEFIQTLPDELKAPKI